MAQKCRFSQDRSDSLDKEEVGQLALKLLTKFPQVRLVPPFGTIIQTKSRARTHPIKLTHIPENQTNGEHDMI